MPPADELLHAVTSSVDVLTNIGPDGWASPTGGVGGAGATLPRDASRPRVRRTRSGNYALEELPELSYDARQTMSEAAIFDYEKRRSMLRTKGFSKKLGLRSDVLKYKLTTYNRWYDGSQVLVITVSVLIGIIGGISAEMVSYNQNNQTSLYSSGGIVEADLRLGFNIAVFILSSFNAFVVAFVNARRWKDVAIIMEEVLGKANQVNIELSLSEGELYRITDAAALNEFHIRFDATINVRYHNARNEISKVLSRQSLTKNLNMYYNTNVQRARDHGRYRLALAASMIDTDTI